MPDFLLEIGTEEIPARMIDAARDELARRVGDLLIRERLTSSVEMEAISTPRRLSVIARNIFSAQADVEEQVLGPSVKVAFKDGAPTPAALAFAKKSGIDVSTLDRVSTPKGEYICARVSRRGRATSEILADLLPKEINGIYWPKSMYWRGKNAERFVRPVRWLVAMLGGEIVPVEYAGIVANSESRGHRQLSGGPIRIHRPDTYRENLAAARVLDEPERLHRIRKSLDAATRTVPGARWREDNALLNTVLNLTEFPSVILGSFDREFLALPEEVLVTVMRDHQKYFAVEDASGKLAPYFLAVLNTDGDPDGIIRHGHERVLRARFNDARFFWNTDQKIPLVERVDMLRHVTFQKDLGSYYEKAERVVLLADKIAESLETAGVKLDRVALKQAARLAKTDLTTELVKEFTELQGIVGGLYAGYQRLGQATADAIYDQYRPEFVEDRSPKTIEGAILSIADKADSVAGMFALGLQPTGSKDPFALRRQANGVVKTIAEHKLSLGLATILAAARKGYAGSEVEKKFSSDAEYTSSITLFFRERLEFYLRDALGYAYDVVNAVLAAEADDVVDVVARAASVSHVRPSEDFEHISVAFKRMKNILRQAREAGKPPAAAVDSAVIQEDAERTLAAEAPRIAALAARLKAKKNYEQALAEVSKLRPAIDAFFDKVMVMVDDERVRANRLALLQTLLNDFSTIADFSEIVTEAKTQ